MMRYEVHEELGNGAFGTVYKAFLPTTGDVVAVKVIRQEDRPRDYWNDTKRLARRGEGTILPSLNHAHIIRCFHSQGWETSQVEIFTDLMDGSLQSLAYNLPGPYHNLANRVLSQMLQALAYLGQHGLVHRDVKPENIFYRLPPGAFEEAESYDAVIAQCHFCLGDFGLCESEVNISLDAVRGSTPYLAPELLKPPPRRRYAQSHKSDVWALMVSVLWTMNTQGIRRTMSRWLVSGRDIEAMVRNERNNVIKLEPMARLNPRLRASAEEMLRILYGWTGLGRL